MHPLARNLLAALKADAERPEAAQGCFLDNIGELISSSTDNDFTVIEAFDAWIDAGRPIDDTHPREALAAAAMIARLASVSRHHHPHNLPNEVAATHQADAAAFLSRHGLDAGGRWIVPEGS